MNQFTLTYRIDSCNECPYSRTSCELHDDPFSSEPVDDSLWCINPPPNRGGSEFLGIATKKIPIPDWCVKLKEQKMFESGWTPYSSS